MWRHIRCYVPSPRSKGFQSSGLSRANLDGKNPIAAPASLTGADDVGLGISGPGMQRSPFWGNRTIPPGNGLHLAGSLLVSGLANVLVRLLRGDPAPPSGSCKRMARKRAAGVLINTPLRPGLLAIRRLGERHRLVAGQMDSPRCRRVEAKEKFSSMQGQRSAVSLKVRRGAAGRASSGGCGRGGERSVTERVCVREERGPGGPAAVVSARTGGGGGGGCPSFHGGGLELPLWGARTCCFPIGGGAPARCQPYFPSCADDAAYSVHVAQRSDGESRKEQPILLASGRAWSTSPLPLRRKTDVQRRQGRETEVQGSVHIGRFPNPSRLHMDDTSVSVGGRSRGYTCMYFYPSRVQAGPGMGCDGCGMPTPTVL